MKRQNLKLSIPTPCDKKWSEMTPVKGGNFCHQCTTRVVDFTHMTDAEIARFFQENDGPICGRLWQTQLNRPIVGPHKSHTLKHWKIAAAVSAGLAVSTNNFAQNTPPTESTQIEVNAEKRRAKSNEKEVSKDSTQLITGKIIEELGEPLIGASVYLKGTKNGTVTNIDGNFEFAIPSHLKEVTLVISYTGFDTKEISNITPNESLGLILMQEGIVLIGEIVISPKWKGLPLRIKNSIGNLFSKSKETNVYAEYFNKTLSVSFDASRRGTHTLNLYNIAGDLIYTKTFELSKGIQHLETEDLPTDLVAGKYVLQISRRNKVLLTKQMIRTDY